MTTACACRAVLNEYLTLIQREYVQSRTGRAAQTLDFFEQEVARLSGELAERRAQILAFKTENADALPESLDFRLSQRTLLQEQLSRQDRELTGLAEQRARLMRIFETTGQVAGGIDPSATPEQRQLDALRHQFNEVLAVYSPQNPWLKVLRARLARLEDIVRAQPAPDAGTGNPLLDAQLAEIAARGAVLEQERAETATRIRALNDIIARIAVNAIRMDELELGYRNIRLQHDTAVDRLSWASTGERIKVMSRGQRISVIDPPTIPNDPARPNRWLIGLGGSLSGLAAGAGLVLLLEKLDRSIRRPGDLVARLGVTPLEVISYIHTKEESRRRWFFRLARIITIMGAAR